MSDGPTRAINAWHLLGIAPTDDMTAIRRAYARQLKAIDPETDRDGFIALRDARDVAMQLAQSAHADPIDAPAGADDARAAVADEAAPAPADDPAAHAPDPAPDQPSGLEPDYGRIHDLHAMVFGDRGVSADAMVAQVEAIFADPALINVDEAARLENFIAETIAHGTPRSDPLVEPAIRYFRWDAPGREIGRAPILDWILRRRLDQQFEQDLVVESPRYARLLAELRAPQPARRSALRDWWIGPQVEFLLAFLHHERATVFDGLPQGVVDDWVARFDAQRAAMPPIRQLREWRRRSVWQHGLYGKETELNIALYIAILLAPVITVWLLLLPRHSTRERIIGFSYAALYALFMFTDVTSYLGWPQRERTALGAPPPVVHYQNLRADVQPVLDNLTEPKVDFAALRTMNAPLYRAIEDDWNKARAADTPAPYSDFARGVNKRLLETMRDALHDGDPALLKEFAKFYAVQLRWSTQLSPERCIDFIEGRAAAPEFPRQDYFLSKLVTLAVQAGPTSGDKAPSRAPIPKPLFNDAMKLARLEAPTFQAALDGKGTPSARCNTLIALLDASRNHQGPETTKLLQVLFAGI